MQHCHSWIGSPKILGKDGDKEVRTCSSHKLQPQLQQPHQQQPHLQPRGTAWDCHSCSILGTAWDRHSCSILGSAWDCPRPWKSLHGKMPLTKEYGQVTAANSLTLDSNGSSQRQEWQQLQLHIGSRSMLQP